MQSFENVYMYVFLHRLYTSHQCNYCSLLSSIISVINGLLISVCSSLSTWQCGWCKPQCDDVRGRCTRQNYISSKLFTRDSCTCDTECYILQFLTNAPLSPKQGGGVYSNYLSSGSIMRFSDYATINGRACMTENVRTKQSGSETTHIVEVRWHPYPGPWQLEVCMYCNTATGT